MVPWWAVWPFETLVLAKQHVGSMPEFSDGQRTSLAAILKQLTTRYDNLFRDELSLHDGISPDAYGWEEASRVALPRALLSAAAKVGDGEEVHGGV